MSTNMLRNQAFLHDSLEVISDWRLLTFCSKYCFNVPAKEFANMFRRSLLQAFGQDKKNYKCNDIQVENIFPGKCHGRVTKKDR